MHHDQNFKNLILDYPRQALAFFAPDEAASIDADARIVPVRQEQLKERLGERFRELDTPLLVEWPDGRREALLFLVEEETDTRRFSVHRLVHYCVDLAELLETDRVVPVVIFLRGGHHPGGLSLGGDRHSYLDFRYLSCQLPELQALSYLSSDNLVARLNLPNMTFAREQKVDVYAQAVRGLLSLESDPERQIKYLDFIDIYSGLDDNEMAIYRQRYAEEVQTMSSFAERFREEGLQQGMQQGMQEGARQGEARVLLRQLALRFGDLPRPAIERIESADAETLLCWSERVLSAGSLEEVFV